MPGLTNQGTGSWADELLSDEAANDSDKSFTVPAGRNWHVLWIWVEYTSTAAVGNRQLVIQTQDNATDVIAEPARAGVVQAASLTRNYMFASSLADLLGFRDTNYLTTPLPPTLILGPGDIIRIYDNKAIAAAADDMVVQMKVRVRGA